MLLEFVQVCNETIDKVVDVLLYFAQVLWRLWWQFSKQSLDGLVLMLEMESHALAIILSTEEGVECTPFLAAY